ncbi:MAG TPA: hypothetical protein VFC21_06865, partial [Bryobacteraceae bacterium]|nr:hypothetical protein [Bryobacteraceae bacterium]
SRCSGCSRCSDCSDLNNASPVELQSSESLAVPVIENLHKKLYAAVTATEESLDMRNVHSCATTHCRAGWVVTLAGESGAKLESRFGWDLAAMKIYDASCHGFRINPCRFYDSDEDAMADMKRLAELEAQDAAR